MTSKRPLSASCTSLTVKLDKFSATLSLCKVCGDQAIKSNYGALSCNSCKTFFRRNGFRPERVRPCQYIENCDLTQPKRQNCTACRLKKCFAVGMNSDHIRKEIPRRIRQSTKSHQTQLSTNTTIPISRLPILNLLERDRSLLSSSQWTLLSNIIHAFDRFSLTPKLLQMKSDISIQMCFDPADVLSTFSSSLASVQSFVNCIPDFQVLNVNEQQSLVERNLNDVAIVGSHIFFRDSNLFNSVKYCNSYATLFGPELLQKVQDRLNQLDLDSTLLQISLLVIMFSSNMLIVDAHENKQNDRFLYGTYRLFSSQNVYAELLWKYMTYRYGFDEAVIRFTRFIGYILDNITQSAAIYASNIVIRDFIEAITEKASEEVLIHQNEPLVLWGKDYNI